jgi:hypothetical protein
MAISAAIAGVVSPMRNSVSQCALHGICAALQYPIAAREQLAIIDWCRSVPEQTLEARRRQFGVSNGMLDRPVAQIALDGSRIDPIIRQLVATAMPQHVRVNLHEFCIRA